MYPPQEDNKSVDPDFPETFLFRSAKHLTRIRANGALEIEETRTRALAFSKPGRDGLSIREDVRL